MDIAAIRAALCDAASTIDATLNVYPYPDPQPEYPALVLPDFDQLEWHAVTGGGAAIDWRAQLLVADPDTATAMRNLESLLVSVALGLEDATSAAFVNVTVHRAGNVRHRDQTDAMSCDVMLTVQV